MAVVESLAELASRSIRSVLSLDSLHLAAALGLVVAGVMLRRTLAAGGTDEWHRALLFALVAGLAAFAIVEPVATLFLGDARWSFALVGDELRTGTFGLRISSLLVGSVALVATWHLADDDDPPGADVDLDGVDVEPYLETEDIEHLIAAQNGVYLGVIAALWFLWERGDTGVLGALLNWALFFVVDDWIIISGYERALEGRTLTSHRVRIGVFNAGLAIGLAWLFWTTFPWLPALLGTLGLVFLLGWRYGPSGLALVDKLSENAAPPAPPPPAAVSIPVAAPPPPEPRPAPRAQEKKPERKAPARKPAKAAPRKPRGKTPKGA